MLLALFLTACTGLHQQPAVQQESVHRYNVWLAPQTAALVQDVISCLLALRAQVTFHNPHTKVKGESSLSSQCKNQPGQGKALESQNSGCRWALSIHLRRHMRMFSAH